MTKNVATPDKLHAQAFDMADAEQVPVEEYIARLLADQLKWKRYSVTLADREQRRFAGVHARHGH